jgi:hypothetical protein
MRSAGRVTILVPLFLLLAAAGALHADDTPSGIDREVVLVGEDRTVLAAPDPAGWAVVDLPALDLSLPALEPDAVLVLPPAPWSPPGPVQVIALMEAPDV